MTAGRYLARLGRPSASAAPGPAALQLWADAPVIALGTSGAIVGHLFPRTIPSRRVTALREEEIARIVATGGARLVDDYWGGYCAIIDGPYGACLLRDPSGAMPCLFVEDASGVWLANDAAALAAAAGGAAVDLVKLAGFLCGIEHLGRSTCLAGVSELWPGERLRLIDSKAAIETLWTPWQHVAPAIPRSAAEAAAMVRETVSDCVRSWASAFPSILLGVSGGLDSSIVAGAATGHCADLRLLNLVGPDADGDETHYARLLAYSLGRPLAIRNYALGAVAIENPSLAHLPWPVASFFTQAIAAVHGALAADRPIDAYFTGNGGDNIFCSMGSARPVADRFIASGLSPGTVSTASDVARLGGASLPAVVRAAWSLLARGKPAAPPPANRAGLSRAWCEAQALCPELLPWAAPAGFRLPGKAMHVRLLGRAMKGHELYARSAHPPQIAPLLAQPIVDLCLAIPSWQWVEGGRDRAVARAAFADLLPPAIVARRSKGGPTGFMLALYRRDARKIAELLADGLLMQTGMLDSSYVRAIDCDRPGGAAQAIRLLTLASAENWVRYWSERGEGAPLGPVAPLPRIL